MGLALLAGAVAFAAGIWVWLSPPSAREPRPTHGPRAIRFESAPSGIDFVLNNGTTADKPMPDSTLGGVAVLDCDNDGLLDIYFANGARFPDLSKADPSFRNRLYRNLGDRRFEDLTESAGVAGAGYSMGVAAGDYDNDGRTDLYVAGVNRNILFRNAGACRFEDVTDRAGVSAGTPPSKPWSVAAAWLDYDGDGYLDLLVVNYLDWSWRTNRVCGDPGRRLSCSPAHYEGLPNILYRNRGNGTFEDVSAETGIGRHVGKGMSAAVADFDLDGYQDVFVTNDSVRNFLFRNVRGERFEEVGVQAGVAFTGDGVPVSSMGVDFRDLDGDRFPDAVVTALAGETYPLFLNRRNGEFSDETYATRLGLESFTMSGWSAGAFDLDNDGDRDIFAANSHVSENVGQYRSVEYRLPNAVFQRLADGTYRDIGPEAGAAMQDAAPHRGAAFGDLDNDGRVDVVVSAVGEEAKVLFNESDAGSWLTLDLEGTASNRSGIGARIRIADDAGHVQHNQASTAVGYASSSDSRVHFGLGESRTVRTVEIHWPSGAVQTLSDIETGQILNVRETPQG
ncbi:MAG: CRTAC1 family protein [Bryobacterales bacterium]|nr:CRTAC1 family protein [Bryobacterales bacterium]MDE0628664.1 CRTAC1 family protein [Bryobacterales bacterium]